MYRTTNPSRVALSAFASMALAAGALATAQTAGAAPESAPIETSATAEVTPLATVADCFVGDAGPYDIVGGPWSVQPPAGYTVQLRCGDPTKGVLHIEASHPVEGNTANFSGCVDNVLRYGSYLQEGTAPGSIVWQYQYAVAGGTLSASVVFDSNTGDVLTAYAGGGQGNDWTRCNAG